MTFGQYGKPKQCDNGCGIEIAYDKQGGYFINTSNSQRHDCPKWEERKKQQQAAKLATTTGLGENNILTILTEIRSELAAVKSQQIKDSQNISMNSWMVEKVAKKVGVDDLVDDTSK